MRIKRIVFCILFLSAFGLNHIGAQENINASGGIATGIDGEVNYSVGQTVFNTFSAFTGTISEGVQQPYEIFISTGIDITTVNLVMKIYPNPTVNVLNLSIDNESNEFLFQLYNVDGKMLRTEKVKSKETQIEMFGLVPSVYFLRVIKKGQVVKSFKIIKN